ncbi:facilitated trehalose transporter Tret1 [Fopius arisanus]|uniref:Facilitated trehalose transporter Tret1 n=1 Tax=Fopius arisanus TaxID=64838 RepID=A0A0C9PX82_9HYME|nr:PREDICTED: facilitated trehalose transporter Tret1-like [Fopius arisanus]
MMTMEATAKNKSKVWSQWLAASTLHVLAILDGLVGGWTSPYLTKLTTGAEAVKITNDEASWIATLYLSCQPLGSIVAAVIVHNMGAKKAALFAGVPHALGWSCFLINESVSSIYTARVLCSCGLGMYFSTFPLYIGEIGSPKIRGALTSFVGQGGGIGYLLGNLLGAYLPMRSFALVGLTLSIIFMLSFFFLPDSSHYLVKINKIKKAEKSLKWYSRQTDVRSELDALIEYIGTPQKSSLSHKEKLKLILTPLNRKLLMIVLGIHGFVYLSGAYVIPMYMEILLTTLKIDVMAPSDVVICVAIVAVIGGFVTTYTNDHFGRRTMLAVAALGVSISFILIGINFLLLRHGHNVSNFQWLIIAEFMMYLFFVNVGLTNIPCCIVGEIFPSELKGLGSCLSNIVSALAATVASKGYQPVLDRTSEEFIFFFNASILFALFIYAIAVVPETKGQSLQEIQNMFKKKSERRLMKDWTIEV